MVSCSKSNNNSTPASSNVLYSAWVQVNLPFTGLDSNNDSTWEGVLSAPGITSAVLSHGVIITYVYLGTNNGDSLIINGDGIFDPIYSVGSIDLYMAGTNYNGASFRYVIIPGGTLTGSMANPALKGYSVAQLKALPYAEAMKLANPTAAGTSGSTLK